jgi:hypothetical protein
VKRWGDLREDFMGCIRERKSLASVFRVDLRVPCRMSERPGSRLRLLKESRFWCGVV